jgi:hypothetical protein
MAQTFTTTILKAEGLNATGIQVPPEVISSLGTTRKPKVKVTVNGYTYRTTVSAYAGEVYMLPLSQEHRAAAGVNAGDKVEVTLELDTEPRTVEIPEDLRAALSAKTGALEAFEVLSYTARKEFARSVNEAKAPETKARRIDRIVAQLGNSE